MSFNVFAKARPVRTAFIFADTTGFDEACDGLARWSGEFWGGRQSAVASIRDDGTLDPEAWQELGLFDPDVIYSFAPLPDELLRDLDEKISPWLITKQPPRYGQGTEKPEQNPLPTSELVTESVQAPGTKVPPTMGNLGQLPKRPLLLFEFGKDCPLLLRRFVNRNFGTYYQWYDLQSGKPRQLGWMEELVSNSPVEHCRVDDLGSLCAVMERMSGTPHRSGWKPPLAFTTPCELSGIHLVRDLSRGVFQGGYRVVIGSSLRDFLLYWRSCLNEGAGAWDAPFRHCLWIPSELLNETTFIAALKNWFYRFTGQGNSGSRVIELTSVSRSREDVSAFADKLRAGNFLVHIRLITPAEIESRWQKDRAEQSTRREFFPSLSDVNAERFVAVERTQTWEMRPAEVIQKEVPSGTWAVDVQIEREPRVGESGQDWWHLPRRSGRQLVASMFRAPARISRRGYFAVRVEGKSIWPGPRNPPQLELRLPPDDGVLDRLLRFYVEPWFDYSDIRYERLKIKPVVTGMEISDAGRKLRGLIELFGGFWLAHDFWGRSCWREIFCRMAGRGADYDDNLRTRIERAAGKELKKITPPIPSESTENAARRIGQRVLNLVGERLPGVPMTFSQMEQIRLDLEKDGQQSPGAYMAGDTMIHMGTVLPLNQAELKQGLESLVELGVLQMCLEARCPRCRMRHWIGIEDLRHTGPCPGCGSSLSVIPESPWSYELNPLVRQCVNSRVFAVWQSLAEVANRIGSFFFAPSAELYFAEPINSAPKREVDVLCVSNGKLLLGEVKEGTLHESDFLDFAPIVAKIRPDRAGMFVNADQFSRAKTWFEPFKQQIAPLGIRGELFSLPNY